MKSGPVDAVDAVDTVDTVSHSEVPQGCRMIIRIPSENLLTSVIVQGESGGAHSKDGRSVLSMICRSHLRHLPVKSRKVTMMMSERKGESREFQTMTRVCYGVFCIEQSTVKSRVIRDV